MVTNPHHVPTRFKKRARLWYRWGTLLSDEERRLLRIHSGTTILSILGAGMATDSAHDTITFRELKALERIVAGEKPSHVLRSLEFGRWICEHPTQFIEENPALRERLAAIREKTLVKIELKAEQVLEELIASYAGLLAQEQRLLEMLGHDYSDLYSEDTGKLKSPPEWPEIWRTKLISEFEERLEHGRPANADGKAWEPVATITKVKRERTLDIEKALMQCQKEKREVLGEIGRHIDVKAFPVAGEKLADAVGDLAGSIDRAISEGRQRAAQRNRLTENNEPD